ncbi:tRNA (adenosine(37)-N6)-dimethylallyltransferase MiaA [Gleimia europaea]|nr:tRNA (adenosine(37)-N6)-dimethylallyltransferase MiaA [Gleimia europaea]MDK8533734.1 tRNA (adenosine(37)-N6)-dimethylallyltransferase MiaA [Gleimia europaea]
MLIGIVGATASGKSGLALDLARELGRAEIVSMDAFSLYKGMDIGTAKPSAAERAEILHHQIDVLDIYQEASVAQYQVCAREDVYAIEQRGNRAIAVGGSALYIHALFDKIEFPGTDPVVRARVEESLEEHGQAALYRRLRELDPKATESIHPNDQRRTVRALEVIELTGRPFSATMPKREFLRPSILLGVRRSLEELDARIAMRTEKMLEAGFVGEVEELMRQGLADTPTAVKATGYQPIMRHLGGEITLDETRELIELTTRQLVRKQMKWFRRDERIKWIEGSSSELREQALAVAQEV